MTREQQHLDAVRRSNFYIFVIEAFRILHPGAELSKEPYLEAMCLQLQEEIGRASCRERV